MPPLSTTVLSLISIVLNILLGGGLLAIWFKYKIQVRSANRSDFELIVNALRTQREDDLERIDALETRLERQEDEIHGLRIARDLDPFPNWVVDRNGEYLFVNREFERYFLEPIGQTYRDIVGKTHEEHWPPDFCKILKSLDGAARTRPDGTARASAALEVPEFGRTKVTVHKFPIRFKPSGIIVAYAGFITDFEPESETVARQLEQPS